MRDLVARMAASSVPGHDVTDPNPPDFIAVEDYGDFLIGAEGGATRVGPFGGFRKDLDSLAGQIDEPIGGNPLRGVSQGEPAVLAKCGLGDLDDQRDIRRGWVIRVVVRRTPAYDLHVGLRYARFESQGHRRPLLRRIADEP